MGSREKFFLGLLFLLLILWLPAAGYAATYVVDSGAGTGGLGALFRVDSATGTRTLLSDFGDGTQGPTGVNPVGVAVESSGQILVADKSAGTGGLGALFRVNSVTGARTLLSDFGNGTQGPLGTACTYGLAIESSGNILVTDCDAGTGADGALFRVNPSTGARTILSDFGNGTQGPTGVEPFGLAIESNGQILVADLAAGTGADGALFRVNPTTGTRTIVSDFGNGTQGPTGIDPWMVAVESSGKILVVDYNAGTSGNGALFRVDPATGARTLLSDFGNVSQGPTVSPGRLSSVAVESSGRILVTDSADGTGDNGELFAVDPATGARTILSDFGNGTQGPTGSFPGGVAVFGQQAAAIPTMNEWGMIIFILLAGLGSVYCLRRQRRV